MNETTSALKELAGTPVGLTVLIVVGILVAAGGGVLLWRALKYLFRASLWLLLLLLVLALAAGAIWAWIEYKNPDPDRRERMRQELLTTLRPGSDGTNSVEEAGGAEEGGHE